MAGPIRPRRFERETKPLRSEEAQAPRGQGRPGHVAAQAFESEGAENPREPRGIASKIWRNRIQGILRAGTIALIAS